MKKISAIFLVIFLLIPSISSGFEPFFYGDWNSDITAIKKIETRELISIDETSSEEKSLLEETELKGFTNITILKYKVSSTEEDTTISYFFNDNKLILVSWILNLQNINSTDAEALLEDYKTQIINKLNNASIIERNKVSNDEKNAIKSWMRAIFIKEEISTVSIFIHYSAYESKLWCSIDFANINAPFNTGILNFFNNHFTNHSNKIKTTN